MRSFYFIILSLFAITAYSQGGFRKRLYDPLSLQLNTKDVFETTPGNYIAAGVTIENQNQVSLLILNGLNNLGQVQWTKKFGSLNLQFLNNPFGTRSFIKAGNFIYGAYAMRDSTQKIIGTLVKFDFNGDKIWQRFFRDSLFDVIPQIVCQGTDGGFLITGFYQDTSISPCMLIKTDALGNELWQKKIHKPAPNVSEGRGIAQDSTTKKIVIVGYQYISNAINYLNDHLLVVDSLGNILSRTNNFVGGNTDVIKCKDGKFVVTGMIRDNIVSTNEWSYIKKFDINTPSAYIWEFNNFGPTAFKAGFKNVIELANGDLIVGGYLHNDTVVLNMRARLLRLSPSGVIKWEKLYNYTFNPNANNYQDYTSINPTSDGGWVTSFRCSNLGPNAQNPLFYVKYDSTGCDTTMVYCSNPVGHDEFYNKTGLSLEMFPNPAIALVHFKLNAPPKTNFTIKIQSVSGHEIERFSLIAQNELQLNTSNYAPGIYFVNVLMDGKAIETKKLLIVR